MSVELSGKATREYVDAELSRRAVQSVVDAALLGKADRSYVDAEAPPRGGGSPMREGREYDAAASRSVGEALGRCKNLPRVQSLSS